MIPLFLLLCLAAVPLEKGSLALRAEPRTEIIWEGVSLGSTNSDGLLIIQDVPPGTFTVTLRKNGFYELTTDIEVLEGDAELVLELEAIPKAPPKAPPRKPPPPPRPVKEKQKTAGTPVEKAPPESPEPAGEETEKIIAEEVSDPAPSSGAGYYLLTALVLVGIGIYGLQKFKSIRETATPDPAAQASETPEETAIPEPDPENLEPAPFLEELKTREKMMDEDVEIIPPEPPRVIDIESIREVEEET